MQQRFIPRVLGPLAVCAALLGAASAVLPAWSKPSPDADRKTLTRERDSLKGQISDIRRDINRKEARLDAINTDLRKSEQAISRSSRTLKELSEQKKGVENQLSDLRREAAIVGEHVKDAEGTVALISRAQYMNTLRHPWQTVLMGGNPNDISRMTGMLRYMAREQDRTIDRLENRQKNIAEVTRKTNAKRTELAKIEKAEQDNRLQLEREKKSRETALTDLKKALDSQRARYEQLVKNDRELSNLIAGIDKRIAEAAKKEAARQLALKKEAEKRRREQKATARTEPPAIASPSLNFRSLRGKLLMPTRGTVAARFGQKRAGAAASLPWRGLLIRAKPGQSVVATAPGTVVFSDWMRGFGNLLILDHGSNYLSVYANNESLYKSVGDKVRQGETIASVGSSGGEDEPGLYFELRYKGKPFDPSRWLAR